MIIRSQLCPPGWGYHNIYPTFLAFCSGRRGDDRKKSKELKSNQKNQSSKKMWKLEDGLWMLMRVMLRKSLSVYHEFAHLAGDLVSILTSMLRFSNWFLHPSRYPHRSSPSPSPSSMSIFLRHDR